MPAHARTFSLPTPAALQVVHDIEYGYVDPLRCKVGGAVPSPLCRRAALCRERCSSRVAGRPCHVLLQVQPEFSLRILDDAWAKQNRTIAAIQVGPRRGPYE